MWFCKTDLPDFTSTFVKIFASVLFLLILPLCPSRQSPVSLMPFFGIIAILLPSTRCSETFHLPQSHDSNIQPPQSPDLPLLHSHLLLLLFTSPLSFPPLFCLVFKWHWNLCFPPLFSCNVFCSVLDSNLRLDSSTHASKLIYLYFWHSISGPLFLPLLLYAHAKMSFM